MTDWIHNSLEPRRLSESWVVVGYVVGALAGAAVAAALVSVIVLVVGIPA